MRFNWQKAQREAEDALLRARMDTSLRKRPLSFEEHVRRFGSTSVACFKGTGGVKKQNEAPTSKEMRAVRREIRLAAEARRKERAS